MTLTPILDQYLERKVDAHASLQRQWRRGFDQQNQRKNETNKALLTQGTIHNIKEEKSIDKTNKEFVSIDLATL